MEKKMPEECGECEFEELLGTIKYCSFGECPCDGCEYNKDSKVCEICIDQ